MVDAALSTHAGGSVVKKYAQGPVEGGLLCCYRSIDNKSLRGVTWWATVAHTAIVLTRDTAGVWCNTASSGFSSGNGVCAMCPVGDNSKGSGV